MADGADDTPSDRMGRRIPGGRARAWVLMNASRWLVTAVLLGVLFVLLVVLGAVDPAPLRQAVGSKDPVETLFQGLLTAIITGVTLVVTINQLVLSQELGAVGDQRERMEGAMQFRRDVEDLLDEPVSPPDPASFLRALVEETRERADALDDAVGDDAACREAVASYVEDLDRNASQVSDELADAQFGTFEVLYAALDFNYSWKIHQARRLQAGEEGEPGEAASAALGDLIEALELFGPAREHFKTLYFQWELIDLSRAVLYAAVPALVVAIAAILYADNPGSVTGTTLGVDHLVWLVAGATTVALAPFALLGAYVLRIATVAKRTLAIGPFVLRETDRDGE